MENRESSSSGPERETPPDSLIAALLVVGFHHAYGPIVEYCIPPLPQQQGQQQERLEKLELPEEWSLLPFLALPDGAHQKDEDFSYFHLPPVHGWNVAEMTLFGISCNRQIAVKDLNVKTPDMTRTTVQKAVVVLARQPIFGPLRQKLAVITNAWFNQKDFTQLGILHNLYSNLKSTYNGQIDDSTLYMGTSLRELLYKFRSKTLTLLKLLMLESRILFYGYPVERLCTFQYSLISLVPGLLRSLQDAGEPEMDKLRGSLRTTEAKELSSGDKDSLLRFMGLPLRLFEKGSFFQPYLPLQQIDVLSSEKTLSYVVGTTNQIFFHQKSNTNIDVLVNVESGSIEFYNEKLADVVRLTMADRRWMEKIVRVVNDTWDLNDPSRPLQNTYLGSDDYLRARFEEYLLSLLSSVKHAQDSNLMPDDQGTVEEHEEVMRDDDRERNYLTDYGMRWIMAWRETNNFALWNQYTDHEIYEIVEPGHPGSGNISITDIQNTLSNRLRDLQLRQNLAPLRNTLSRAMSGSARVVSSGRSRLLRGMDALWHELDNQRAAEQRSTPPRSPTATDSAQRRSISSSDGPISPILESTTQHAGRLFSNVSSFLSRRQREISQAVESSQRHEESAKSSDDDTMAREQYNAKILGESLYKKVASSRVLLVGAGGIGCELLKNLVMSGFPSIEVIDLDTIDMTNLNRQFLFQKQHVKQSKAHVARESALKFNPNTKIVSHQANIMDPQFNVSWFAEFTIVFNALDNLEARRHVNQMCLAAGVPLVESGTEGYEGQAYVIKKGLTECFDCYPKPTRTTYPVCTIRSTPSAPIHCIVWAKSYLFSQLFGDSEGEQDMKQDATDDNKELAALARETEELKSIKAAMGTPEYAKKVFEKVFTTDIGRLLSMEEMWKTRTKPTPLDYDTLEKSPQSEKELEENDALKDQKVWSIEESFRVFQKSVEQLSDRLKAAQKERADAVLTFDKDDDDAMDFVTATANLRAHIFGIPLKSRFQVKSMAGNIIPAIATTNAVIAGLAVMQGFALLRGNVTNYKRTYLKTVSRQPPLLMLENSRGPNPDCSVCSSASIKVHVDFSKAKLRDVLDTVVTAPVDKGGAGMDLEDVAIMHGSRMIYDIDFDDNLDATIKDLGITEGTILRVSGDSNVQELDLILLGKESGDAVELKEKVPKLERRTRKRSLEEEEMPAGEPDAKKQRVEGNNNEIVIIDDDEGDNAGVISLD